MSARFVKLVAVCAFASLPVLGAADAFAFGPLQKSDPNEQGDGTMSDAARRAMENGALRLPGSDAEKARANRARDAERARLGESAPAPEAPSPSAPQIIGTGAAALNFQGQLDPNSTPPDTTGAIGPTRYIQMVNTRVAIYNRNTKVLLGSGTLNELADNAPSVNSFDPQMIWDAQTNRFYYVMDSIFSSSDNRISFGFSKTASPNNVTTDWCHYNQQWGTRFPDYPKLGDSQHFLIVGVNSFNPGFVGSDITAYSKPPAGTTCPAGASFKIDTKLDLRDTSNNQVFTPVPSNQIDNNAVGYVVSSIFPGGNAFWFFKVTRNATTGLPVFGAGRSVAVPAFSTPPDATQPTVSQVLDTLDTRVTQAVQAINPDRGNGNNVQSFWLQHTVKHPTQNLAEVRWYEINPAVNPIDLLRSGAIRVANTHVFNGAISPDRRRDGTTRQFGDSFVINYNLSSSAANVPPRIRASSSFNGGAVTHSAIVQNSAGGSFDFSCPGAGNICRWGDYAGASPDPRPPAGRPLTNRGVVWGTNQFVVSPGGTASSHWRTKIFAHSP